MGKSTYAKSYRFGSNRVVEMPYFLYEVCEYKLAKNMASILASKYYKSDKPLTIKQEEVILKKTKEYTIVKMIDIVGATKEFIEENKLPLYEPKKKVTKKQIIRKKKK